MGLDPEHFDYMRPLRALELLLRNSMDELRAVAAGDGREGGVPVSTMITRMGDAATVEMTADELRRDIVEGSEAAAAKGKVPVLEEREVEYLYEMFASPSRIWGVERGHEAILTKDGSTNTHLLVAALERRLRAPEPRGGGAPLRDGLRLRHDGGRARRLLGEAGQVPRQPRGAAPRPAAARHRPAALLRLHAEPRAVLPTRRTVPEPVGPAAEGKIDEARAAQEEALEACARTSSGSAGR